MRTPLGRKETDMHDLLKNLYHSRAHVHVYVSGSETPFTGSVQDYDNGVLELSSHLYIVEAQIVAVVVVPDR
jgi:hypothetical protein